MKLRQPRRGVLRSGEGSARLLWLQRNDKGGRPQPGLRRLVSWWRVPGGSRSLLSVASDLEELEGVPGDVADVTKQRIFCRIIAEDVVSFVGRSQGGGRKSSWGRISQTRMLGGRRKGRHVDESTDADVLESFPTYSPFCSATRRPFSFRALFPRRPRKALCKGFGKRGGRWAGKENELAAWVSKGLGKD